MARPTSEPLRKALTEAVEVSRRAGNDDVPGLEDRQKSSNRISSPLGQADDEAETLEVTGETFPVQAVLGL